MMQMAEGDKVCGDIPAPCKLGRDVMDILGRFSTDGALALRFQPCSIPGRFPILTVVVVTRPRRSGEVHDVRFTNRIYAQEWIEGPVERGITHLQVLQRG